MRRRRERAWPRGRLLSRAGRLHRRPPPGGLPLRLRALRLDRSLRGHRVANCAWADATGVRVPEVRGRRRLAAISVTAILAGIAPTSAAAVDHGIQVLS